MLRLLLATHLCLRAAARDAATEAWVARWKNAAPDRCAERDPKACAWLAHVGPVDVGCAVEISALSLGADQANTPPALAVRSGDGDTTTYEAPLGQPHTHLALPSLCAYGLRTEAQADIVALVAANDLNYVFRQWASLANKAVVFKAANLHWSLWVGDLPTGLATTASEACERRAANPSVRKMSKPTKRDSVYHGNATHLNSNHLVKVLAAYAQAPGGARGVFRAERPRRRSGRA